MAFKTLSINAGTSTIPQHHVVAAATPTETGESGYVQKIEGRQGQEVVGLYYKEAVARLDTTQSITIPAGALGDTGTVRLDFEPVDGVVALPTIADVTLTYAGGFAINYELTAVLATAATGSVTYQGESHKPVVVGTPIPEGVSVYNENAIAVDILVNIG